MTTPSEQRSIRWPLVLFVMSVPSAGCVLDLSSGSGSVNAEENCITLDFDFDGNGAPIARGTVLENAYAALGIFIDVYDGDRTTDGLGVAFDSSDPTGGDDDLAFVGLGNVLINQENFDNNDVAAGFVAVPDDEAHGALFEFRFDEPVCVKSMTLMDIDFDEAPTEFHMYDANGDEVASHFVDPMGNNVRLELDLPPAQDCVVVRATVWFESSGAMDNLQVCTSKVEPQLWTRVLDNGGDDDGHGVATDSVGDVVVAGSAEIGAGVDGLVRKYSAAGDVVWTQVFDQGANDSAAAVAVDDDDDIIAVGVSDNGTDSDIWVRKYDTDGVEQWTRAFDGGGMDGAMAVAADGNQAIVAGYAAVGAGTDVWVRRYGASGATVWTHTADIGATDAAFGVAADGMGNVYVAGRSDNGTDHDVWLRKLDGSGDEIWTRVFDGGGDDTGYAVATDPDGAVIVVGGVFNGAS